MSETIRGGWESEFPAPSNGLCWLVFTTLGIAGCCDGGGESDVRSVAVEVPAFFAGGGGATEEVATELVVEVVVVQSGSIAFF